MAIIYIFAGLIFLAIFINRVVIPLIVNSYFNSQKFLTIKAQVAQHITECNELNEHIEDLKSSYFYGKTLDYGEGQLSDTSSYNMQRRKWAKSMNNRQTYKCSASIVKNAHNQPYKYFCKYFNIKADENTLENFEEMLNNFSAVEQGKHLLINERDEIVSSISNSLSPFILNNYRDRVINELGFENISLSSLYFPVYSFQYISAGGNSSSKFDLKFDIEQIERFIKYLANLIEFKNSIAGQRALMTSKLREKIKARDNYTCQICNLSLEDERNLLLEIDHIIPLSKGGVTCESNLQTLCWRCNRTKGSKIYNKDEAQLIAPSSSVKLGMTRPTEVSALNSSTEFGMTKPPEVSALNSSTKLDMTRPPKASASNSCTKLDMTRPPKASASNSSTKLDTTRSPKASASNNSTKLDMTRPSKASESNSFKKVDMPKWQANAVRTAKDYLEYSGYSRKGLIEQLQEGDGYTLNEATAGVESLDVDWREQAIRTAKDYLEYSGYSRKGLIEQLQEGDGYTLSEATIGVESLDIDWREQAVRSAKDYLEYSGYSRKGLIEQLQECDGYTLSEATYATQNFGDYS